MRYGFLAGALAGAAGVFVPVAGAACPGAVVVGAGVRGIAGFAPPGAALDGVAGAVTGVGAKV